MEDIRRKEILVKGNKTYVIQITCTGEAYIATGSLDGLAINETRQAVTDANRNIEPNHPEIENLIFLIKDDIIENEY
jgi:hypothetical protein